MKLELTQQEVQEALTWYLNARVFNPQNGVRVTAVNQHEKDSDFDVRTEPIDTLEDRTGTSASGPGNTESLGFETADGRRVGDVK